jgi:tellurite resistance protein TehA-like permease
MLELARRIWQIFIPAFAVLAGSGVAAFYYFDGKDYQLTFAITLWSFASFFFLIGMIAFICDCVNVYKKHYERTHSIYEKRGPLIF